MKKRDREFNRAMGRVGFRNLGIVRLGPSIKAYVNIWDFPNEREIDDAERLKWFESPNAEGYLDM